MIHLSEVLGMPVVDDEGRRLGRIDDLQVDPVMSRVDRVLLRRGRVLSAVDWTAIETFSPENRRVVLAEGAVPSPLGAESDSVLLKRDVLDRQIIDIRGRKVVRVNDILLESAGGGELALRQVEVGLAGAVRRLLAGIASPQAVRRIAAGLSERGIPWDYVGLVEPRSARIRLKVHQQLARMHPADLADIIEDLGRVERSAIVSQMDPEVAADALSEAEPSVQAAVVETMHTEQAADLLEEMQPDEAADLLGDLPQSRSRELLDAMEEEEAEEVRELLGFSEDTAGGLMTTDFFTASAHWTVEETLRRLREVDQDLVSELDEIPVLSSGDRLVGIAPLVRIVRAPDDSPVTAVMRREARAVTPATRLAEVFERFEKYHLRALCVVDELGALVGLISVEDVLSQLVSRR